MQKIILYTEIIIAILATILISIISLPQSEPTAVINAEAEDEAEVIEEVISTIPDGIYYKDIVEVEYAFIDKGGCGRIRVKNNSENQLTAYTLKIYCFDEQQELTENRTLEVKNIEIASGFSGGMSQYIPIVKGTKYLWARVSSAEFTNAQPWINEDMTEDTQMPLMTAENIGYNADDIKAAENCGFLEITNTAPAKEDVNSERKNLIFYIKNVGDKTVKNVNFVIAEFDDNNHIVNVTPNIYIGENIRQLSWNDINLAPGEGKKAVSKLAIEPECTKVKIIVERAEFENGIVWSNSHALEWICSKMKNQK